MDLMVWCQGNLSNCMGEGGLGSSHIATCWRSSPREGREGIGRGVVDRPTLPFRNPAKNMTRSKRALLRLEYPCTLLWIILRREEESISLRLATAFAAHETNRRHSRHS